MTRLLLLPAACAAAPVEPARPTVDAHTSVLVVDFTDATSKSKAALGVAAADPVVEAERPTIHFHGAARML